VSQDSSDSSLLDYSSRGVCQGSLPSPSHRTKQHRGFDLYPYRSGLCSPARIPLFSVSRVLLVALRAGRLSAHLLGDGSIRSSVYSPTDRFSTLSRSHRSDTVVTPLGAGDSPTRLLLGRQQWRPLSKVATHISIAARRPHLSCGLNAASVQLSPPSVDTSTVLIPRVPA